MLTLTLEELVGKQVEFVYAGNTRTVTVEGTKDCANGSKVLVGRDHDRNMEYRSYHIQKMDFFKVIG